MLTVAFDRLNCWDPCTTQHAHVCSTLSPTPAPIWCQRGHPSLANLPAPLSPSRTTPSQSSSSLVAVHTDAMAAVLECLHVVLRASPVEAGGHALSGGDGVGAMEATGLAFCRCSSPDVRKNGRF